LSAFVPVGTSYDSSGQVLRPMPAMSNPRGVVESCSPHIPAFPGHFYVTGADRNSPGGAHSARDFRRSSSFGLHAIGSAVDLAILLPPRPAGARAVNQNSASGRGDSATSSSTSSFPAIAAASARRPVLSTSRYHPAHNVGHFAISSARTRRAGHRWVRSRTGRDRFPSIRNCEHSDFVGLSVSGSHARAISQCANVHLDANAMCR